MIELHQIDTSERNEPWKIWVNPANVLWIAERDGDELGGTDIYFSGTMLMVSERPQAVLQLLGHLVMPEPDYLPEEETPPIKPPTSEDPRAEIRKLLEAYGLAFIGATSRHAALHTYRNPRGNLLSIQTYVVREANEYGQCSFTVNLKPEKEIDWVLLYAYPFGRFYVKKMSEIRHRNVPDVATPSATQANITIREGSPTDDLLHNRLIELLNA